MWIRCLIRKVRLARSACVLCRVATKLMSGSSLTSISMWRAQAQIGLDRVSQNFSPLTTCTHRPPSSVEIVNMNWGYTEGVASPYYGVLSSLRGYLDLQPWSSDFSLKWRLTLITAQSCWETDLCISLHQVQKIQVTVDHCQLLLKVKVHTTSCSVFRISWKYRQFYSWVLKFCTQEFLVFFPFALVTPKWSFTWYFSSRLWHFNRL